MERDEYGPEPRGAILEAGNGARWAESNCEARWEELEIESMCEG